MSTRIRSRLCKLSFVGTIGSAHRTVWAIRSDPSSTVAGFVFLGRPLPLYEGPLRRHMRFRRLYLHHGRAMLKHSPSAARDQHNLLGGRYSGNSSLGVVPWERHVLTGQQQSP